MYFWSHEPKKVIMKTTFRILGILLVLQLSVGSVSADVILEVSDDGTDLFLQWTGTFDLGSLVGVNDTTTGAVVSGTSQAISVLDGSNYRATFSGSFTGNDPIIGSTGGSAAMGGTGFGFNGANVFWDDSFGANPGIISPTGSFTLTNRTVASMFGSNLDGGPVALWTLTSTGDTISVGLASTSSAAVPEPSAFALLATGLCGAGMIRRHRRQKNVSNR